MHENFAERLKRIRLQREYTQEQLANISKISVQTIRNYEQNVSEPVSVFLLELAKNLFVTPEYLLSGDDNMNSYTDAIKVELMQFGDFDKIHEIKNTELNATILSHLEMSEDLVSSITKNWNSKNIFDSYCTKKYVQDVILKYCQNRGHYKRKFNIKDGMILNTEKNPTQ